MKVLEREALASLRVQHNRRAYRPFQLQWHVVDRHREVDGGGRGVALSWICRLSQESISDVEESSCFADLVRWVCGHRQATIGLDSVFAGEGLAAFAKKCHCLVLPWEVGILQFGAAVVWHWNFAIKSCYCVRCRSSTLGLSAHLPETSRSGWVCIVFVLDIGPLLFIMFDPYWESGAKAPVAMATEKKVTSGPDFKAGASNGLHTWVQGSVTGLGVPLQTKADNYSHYARVLIDVDLVEFVPEKLLLETIDDCIEVDLYFESFLNFCTSYHGIGHSVTKCHITGKRFGDSDDEPGKNADDIVEDEWPPLQVAKCKSVIGKVPPKDGSHANKKENKAPGLNQVYKLKQVPPQHVKSNTPFVPTTNAFEILNIEVTPYHIEDMVHQYDAIPTSLTDINIEMGIEIRPSTSDLGAAPNKTDFTIKT
ncbi:hypothetical protein FNV43_RR15053 [Rhamnella rubrinervis]|uniref:Uncharacterized protein n=1 Tax=Rhamnella rubrinervis TaxID=2594499 RepID=A0A8K0ECA8_9ROSA|nr:hypothetical protein FNV43_RR15053 [Rhamnella rubrinervis]